MKKLFLSIFILFLPLIILFGVFVVLDPFRILYSYDDYSDNLYVMPNRDFVSSRMYLKNKDKYHYDSFIFGSSRTIAFKPLAWQQFLPPASSPFVFDASGESIFGIYTKILYLDKTGTPLKNCLLIIDTDNTFARETDAPGHINMKYPAIAGTSWTNFYITFIKDYFDLNFLRYYLQYLVTHTYKPSMKGYIEFRKIRYDGITNETRILDQDSALQADPVKYYNERIQLFFTRDSVIPPADPLITPMQVTMLKEIMSVFMKQHTDYKLIIGPLYNQVEFNPKDMAVLQEVFGKDHVYNFAGKNQFTAVKENYFESSHYRTFIGDSILHIIYRKGN